MRILNVIKGNQKAAGTSVFCSEILNHLARKGYDCRLLVAERAEDAYPVDRCVKVFYGNLSAVVGGGWKPDVVHVHGIWTPLLHRVCVWAHKTGVKIVFSPHGMLAPWAMMHKRWKKLLPWYLYQRTDVAKAAVIHSTSELETNWIRDLGFTNPITEIPLGTDLSPHLARHDCAEKTILFVGRIYPIKGLDLLIRAWVKIKDMTRRDGWRVVLVGPDQAGYMQVLKELCTESGLVINEDIVFAGPLYGADKDNACLSARALVLPSYTENFGGVVVDALSCGVPVLTSEATPWDFLEELGCGLHFSLDVDALSNTLLKMMAMGDDARREMGMRGRRLVEEKYAWPAIAEKMARAYEEVLCHLKN